MKIGWMRDLCYMCCCLLIALNRYKARDVTNESIVALKKIPLQDVDEGVPSTVWDLLCSL